MALNTDQFHRLIALLFTKPTLVAGKKHQNFPHFQESFFSHSMKSLLRDLHIYRNQSSLKLNSHSRSYYILLSCSLAFSKNYCEGFLTMGYYRKCCTTLILLKASFFFQKPSSITYDREEGTSEWSKILWVGILVNKTAGFFGTSLSPLNVQIKPFFDDGPTSRFI